MKSNRPAKYVVLAFAICFSMLGFRLVLIAQEARDVRPTNPALPNQTYMPVVIDEEFDAAYRRDVDQKTEVTERQKQLIKRRYDVSDRPSNVKMSAGRKAVQQGVRVKLAEGATWQGLAEMSPDEIKRRKLFPLGFRPLPHVKHSVGGQVFPAEQIDAIRKAERRDLERFDVAFDLPAHLTPEFPPPIFLTSRPDLGDVSQGQVLSIKNYYALF